MYGVDPGPAEGVWGTGTPQCNACPLPRPAASWLGLCPLISQVPNRRKQKLNDAGMCGTLVGQVGQGFQLRFASFTPTVAGEKAAQDRYRGLWRGFPPAMLELSREKDRL